MGTKWEKMQSCGAVETLISKHPLPPLEMEPFPPSMVDIIMPSPVPRTCEYVRLQDKGELRLNAIKVVNQLT